MNSVARELQRTVIRSELEVAYSTIKQRILDGTYGPGERLAPDRLAGELEVSLVPAREAVRRLEAEGYVEFERDGGARVARFDPEEYVLTMHVLALLDGYATALAAPHLRPRDLADARRVNRRLRGALGASEPLRCTAFNHELHFVIYARCPDRHVRSLVEVQWARLDAIRRADFVYVPGRAHDTADEHDALLDLLEAGTDPARIEAAARDHKLRSVEAFTASRAAASRAPPAARGRRSARGARA